MTGERSTCWCNCSGNSLGALRRSSARSMTPRLPPPRKALQLPTLRPSCPHSAVRALRRTGPSCGVGWLIGACVGMCGGQWPIQVRGRVADRSGGAWSVPCGQVERSGPNSDPALESPHMSNRSPAQRTGGPVLDGWEDSTGWSIGRVSGHRPARLTVTWVGRFFCRC